MAGVQTEAEPMIQGLFAERIGGTNYGKSDAIYKFEKIKRAKAAAKAEKPDVPLIDVGVGEPDAMAYPQVVEALKAAAEKPENRGYADNGGKRFREAAARHMREVYGVALDPASEIIHSIGSKSALSILPAAFINPGDVVLMTVPGYPVFGTHAKYYGGEVVNLPLTRGNHFLPNLDEIPPEITKRAKVLVLNYPNNPTGASATREFFEKAVTWAKEHEVLILQDAAYAALTFDGSALSILQVPGAEDVALELHSLSKAYNMTGWRIGFVCGNALAVKAYGDVKDNSDSGQFLAIQEAGAVALESPEITREIAQKYARRMKLLAETLAEVGFPVEPPEAGFFLYLPAPKSATHDGQTTHFANGEEVSQWLIRENLISTVPWDDAGSFVRFSVTFQAADETAEKEVCAEIGRRLGKFSFAW